MLKSLLPYVLLLIMTVMGSIASLFLKKAADSMKGDTLVKSILSLLKIPAIYIGGMMYVTAAIINIIVLRFLDYSIVLPLTAFTYVWTIVLARVRLKESISIFKIIGILLIIAGAVLVARF